jgi:hypothetical protein
MMLDNRPQRTVVAEFGTRNKMSPIMAPDHCLGFLGYSAEKDD